MAYGCKDNGEIETASKISNSWGCRGGVKDLTTVNNLILKFSGAQFFWIKVRKRCQPQYQSHKVTIAAVADFNFLTSFRLSDTNAHRPFVNEITNWNPFRLSQLISDHFTSSYSVRISNQLSTPHLSIHLWIYLSVSAYPTNSPTPHLSIVCYSVIQQAG